MKSRVAIKVTGDTRLFTVPFPYLDRNHVVVTVNRVLKYPGADFDWRADGNIEFHQSISGNVLELVRKTPEDGPLVTFYNGAVLTEAELNTAIRQLLYISQEIRDYYDALIDGALDSLVLESGNEEAGPVIDKVIEQVLNSQLLADLQQRITDIDTNAGTITDAVLRLAGLESVVDALATLEGKPIGTVILDERAERIEGDTAIAQTLSLLGAKSGDGLSFMIDLDRVKVSLQESLAERLTAMQSRIGAAEASIASEATARATADSAASTRMDGLLASINSNDSAVRALILNEQTARVAGDQAEASARSVLQTKVNGNTASIEQHSESINGLNSQWTLKVDVNGRVSGIGLASSGTFSEFIVLADRFAVVTPGKSPVVPFAVDANGVYMNQAYIRNLVVDKISGGAITAQWKINDSAGRIVLDTGTHMKVLGVGFGANGDLIEWFGPKMSVSACTKGNAITYVATNGDAYFGGTLSAGTFKNAAQSTQVGANANTTTGEFESFGGRRVVTTSFSLVHTGNRTGNNAGISPVGVTVVLKRNGTTVATYPISGQYRGTYDSETNRTYYVCDFSGSFTYTDNSGGTSCTYSLELTSASGTWPRSDYNITSSGPTQRLSVISVEE